MCSSCRGPRWQAWRERTRGKWQPTQGMIVPPREGTHPAAASGVTTSMDMVPVPRSFLAIVLREDVLENSRKKARANVDMEDRMAKSNSSSISLSASLSSSLPDTSISTCTVIVSSAVGTGVGATVSLQLMSAEEPADHTPSDNNNML